MKVKSQKGQPSDGPNVTTFDLGEKIDGAIEAKARELVASRGLGAPASKPSKFSRFAGGYKPGMYGGYRPWYAQKAGMSGDWKLGAMLGMSPEMKKVGSGLLTGTLIASAGNRVIVWGVATAAGIKNKLLGEAIGFGFGLLPLLGWRTPATFGIALPGTVQLVGALTEELLNATVLPNPGLSGGIQRPQQQMGSQNAAVAARKKLAEVQQRILAARQSAARMPRVMARPRVVA